MRSAGDAPSVRRRWLVAAVAATTVVVPMTSAAQAAPARATARASVVKRAPAATTPVVSLVADSTTSLIASWSTGPNDMSSSLSLTGTGLRRAFVMSNLVGGTTPIGGLRPGGRYGVRVRTSYRSPSTGRLSWTAWSATVTITLPLVAPPTTTTTTTTTVVVDTTTTTTIAPTTTTTAPATTTTTTTTTTTPTTAPATTTTAPATTTTAPAPTTTHAATTTTAPATTTTTPATTTTAPATTTTAPATTTTTAPAPTTTTPPPTRADRLRFLGRDWFASGVNIPWMVWPWAAGHGDFGGGLGDGVQATRSSFTTAFAGLQAAGVHAVRWWTFEGGAHAIRRDPTTNMPTSLDPAVYADFDAAVALANQYDLYYDFVLFGGPQDFPATWRTDPAQRAQLANVLAPLFARYKDNPRVMSWEIFNEPEYDVWNSGGVVTAADLKAMASAIIAALRANAPGTLVTVGSATIAGFNSSQQGIAMWTDVDLDYYSPHWYDQMTSPVDICALCTTAQALQTKFHTTKPIVIGEFQQGSGTTAANTARLQQWYDQGYAGAWGWSLFPNNTGDHFATDLVALSNFDHLHADTSPR